MENEPKEFYGTGYGKHIQHLHNIKAETHLQSDSNTSTQYLKLWYKLL